MIDLHVDKHGYTETLPPFIVNSRSMTNTGQLPKFAEDLFKLENRDYYLIPDSGSAGNQYSSAGNTR
jgi:seryl-tRNA synthetase